MKNEMSCLNALTLEEVIELHEKEGFEFVIEGGAITDVLHG
jgi:hypothetical protein